jgi:hypothetical protein
MSFEATLFTEGNRNDRSRFERHYSMISDAALGVFENQEDLISAMAEVSEE